MNYYNEFDTGAANWLHELIAEGVIPDGKIDTRDIRDVQPEDLDGFTQCHFFAGIGGWPLALHLAGWPADRPVWTGSCPCQPFSAAGKRAGTADARHLWPEFRRLITACRPSTVIGEQVSSSEVVGTFQEAAFIVAVQCGDYARANKLARKLSQTSGFHYWRRWADGIRADLEAEGYTFEFHVLGAHSVGSPNIRQRLYWLADADYGRQADQESWSQSWTQGRGTTCGLADAECAEWGQDDQHRRASRERRKDTGGFKCDSETGGLADCDGERLEEWSKQDGKTIRAEQSPRRLDAGGCGGTGGLGNAPGGRRTGEDGSSKQKQGSRQGCYAGSNPWSEYSTILCRDGKTRRIPAGSESVLQRMVDGIPDDLDDLRRAGFPLCRPHKGRAGLLRGYGNAINAYTAVKFIKATMEHTND